MKKTQTNDEREETTSQQEKTARKAGRSWRFVAVAVAFFFVFSGVGAAYWRWRITRPIDVDAATTSELVGWLALRDLSSESPETRGRLFEKYFDAISTKEGEVTTKIELPPQIKRFTGTFFAGRDEKLADWDANRTRPPYWRLDYLVVAQTPRTSEYVLSSDVRPGPALRERWEKLRAETNRGRKPLLSLEKNVKTLMMQWFVAQYGAYDAAPDGEKKKKIDQSAAELLRWQDFYNGLRADAKLPAISRSDLLKEFEASIESWNEFAMVEEVAKTLWFKDLLESVLASRETSFGTLAQRFGFRKDGATSEFESASEAKPTVEDYPPRVAPPIDASTNGSRARAFADAVRRFVFVDETPNAAN